MAIVGINLTKIDGEKKGNVTGKVSINNNIAVKTVEDAKIGLTLKEKGIQVGFVFTSTYEPKVGRISMEGKVLLLESEENAKNIMANWQKTKKLPPLLMQHVFTTILKKCNIKALVLSEDLGLPSPIRLPEVRIKKVEKPAKQAKK